MTDAVIKMAETERTPGVVFDPCRGSLVLSGESYPEDAGKFYGPILQKIQEYLSSESANSLSVSMRMIYFNSSSAKAVMNLFQMLESAAASGLSVSVSWYHDPDDDMMEEMGEDFSEDFEHARFALIPEQL